MCKKNDIQIFKRYNFSSSMSFPSVLVSPPNTINAFPTSKLACPTLGPGPSAKVVTGAHDSELLSIFQISPTVTPSINPPIM